jgi:hypothetical protein
MMFLTFGLFRVARGVTTVARARAVRELRRRRPAEADAAPAASVAITINHRLTPQ